MNDEDLIAGRANGKCELCGSARHHRGYDNKIVKLSVVYMDGDRENIAPNNVRVMCQGCGRFYERQHHVRQNRLIKRFKEAV